MKFIYIILCSILLTSCSSNSTNNEVITNTPNILITESPIINNTIIPNTLTYNTFNLEHINEYNGQLIQEINNGIPFFTKDEIISEAYESYSAFDDLNRVQVAMACIGPELMPYDDRESISHVDIDGMKQAKYDIVDGKYLYNRSHLIGFQLTGENDNIYNLMTGTRYFNTEGMLGFENIVAQYVTDTFNHVMYRVTPYFKDDELVARGVLMEAYSVEDNGNGVSFNVFIHNIQPGIIIDYKTGTSKLINNHTLDTNNTNKEDILTYAINTNTHKFHHTNCKHAKSIKDKNYKKLTSNRLDIINKGYDPCKVCNP